MPQESDDGGPMFVTGGTGLLGNCIVRELCGRQIPTRVLCRPETPTTPFDDLDVEIVPGDLSDSRLLNDATAGCRAVIHSAALIHIGWQRLDASRTVNVAGTRNIVGACLANRAKLIHISTVDTLPAAVDRASPIDERGQGGSPKTPCAYVISKSEAEQVVEQAIRQEQLPAIITHPGFMLGPFDWKPSSGRMMLEVNKAPVVAAPPGGCSLCDARDVAAGVVQAALGEQVGEHYILAGENLSYHELWSKIVTTTGRNCRVYRLGRGVRLLGAVIDAANRWTPIREGDVNGAAIAMGSLNHFYDSRKAERELQYRRRPIEETLRDAWNWLSELPTR